MKCEELVAYLSDYIDQNLDEDLREDAQEHLATCHNCRVALDTTQQMIFLYRQNGRQGIPAKRRSELYSRLQDVFQAGKKE
jgi:CRISPR/Cas system CSM-associated protein Csm2 small subunit